MITFVPVRIQFRSYQKSFYNHIHIFTWIKTFTFPIKLLNWACQSIDGRRNPLWDRNLHKKIFESRPVKYARALETLDFTKLVGV